MSILSYEQARLVIKDGDIVFVCASSTSFIDKVITVVTGSPFSHVCIAFWVTVGGQSRLMCVEAQGGTARRVVNMSFYEDRKLVIVTPPSSWDKASTYALSKLAKVKYGWGEAAYVGLRDLALRRLNIKLPKRNLEHEICSEFVANTYQLKDTCVSPGDLYCSLGEVGCTVRQ